MHSTETIWRLNLCKYMMSRAEGVMFALHAGILVGLWGLHRFHSPGISMSDPSFSPEITLLTLSGVVKPRRSIRIPFKFLYL